MLKAIVFSILAACGINPTPSTADPPEEPDEYEPVVKPTDQHFCCDSVDPKTETGEGCDPISGSLETIAACSNVLYCSGNWTKQDGGKVTCTTG